jgi:CDP-4-dehydro-6-deoxyglucose reductase, E3
LRVNLNNASRSFSVEPQQSLLDAALNASLNLPHSCKGGNCGSCRARLLEGQIHYPNGPPLGISAAEVADGLILLCQARALTDLCLETFDMQRADEAVVKRLPCRIERAVPLSHDVMQLYLRLPAAEDFHFEPGQYVDIMLPGGRRRSFSIASPPHDSRPLELHVRRVAGGEFTEKLFHEETKNSLLSIEGPLGQFVYRESHSPMLLIGGGTGLAPLMSILRHVLEKGMDRDLWLYWGVRSENDLYAHQALQEFAARFAPNSSAQQAADTGQAPRHAPRFRYTPVLSEASPEWRGRTGWVHEAPRVDIEHFEPYEVYAAGPPVMISAVRREFEARGVAPTRIFFDSFDYAPDALERQRMSASTTS